MGAKGDGIDDVLGANRDELRIELSGDDGTVLEMTHRVPVGNFFTAAGFRVEDASRVGLMVELGCHAPCGATCTGECLAGRCVECTASAQCDDGLCTSAACSF